MNSQLKSALQRWERLETKPETDQESFHLVDLEIDRLLHGDSARGKGVPWSLYTRSGSALREYENCGSGDENMRVIAQFIFDRWAKEMTQRRKQFMFGHLPLFYLFVTPDDPNQLGGFELKAIGAHNHYAGHSPDNRSFGSHCWQTECVGYGYSPIDPEAKPNLAVVLKALAVQDTVYPEMIGIGRDVHLIIGTDGQVLVMRETNNWQIEVANLKAPPSPPQEGPERRRCDVLPTTTKKLVGELGVLEHSPLWGTSDPSLLRTTERWRTSRTATFTPTGGEPERLTIINSESYKMCAD